MIRPAQETAIQSQTLKNTVGAMAMLLTPST